MSWVICDYGEVLSLAPPAEDRASLEAAAEWQGTSEAFWNSYWSERPSYDRGDVSAAEYWESVLSRGVVEEDLDRIIQADVAGWLHPNLRSIEAIGELKERGARLALFSNAPVEVAAGIAAAPWMVPFSRKFFSCDIRAVKPEAGSYKAVLEGLHAKAEEVVFVDDRPVNIAGAAAIGMRAVLFESPEQLAGVV